MQKVLCCGGKCVFTKPRVAWKGDPNHSFAIVGESPGSEEVREGLPFVGPSGFVLNQVLQDYPDLIDPFVTNAFQCRPGSANREDPERMEELKTSAAKQCQPRLLQEIKYAPRKVILALGNAAVRSLTNEFGLKITQIRGRLIASEYASIGIIPTYHPAFLLRGNGSLRQFRADIDHAVNLWRGNPIRQFVPPTWEIIDNSRQLIQILERNWFQPEAAGDCETDGLFYHLGHTSISMGWTYDGKHVYLLPEEMKPWYNYLFKSPHTKWTWHNGKFDYKILMQDGCPDVRVDNDSMLQSYCLDEMRGVHNLETVSHDWLHSPNWKNAIDALKPKGKAGKTWTYRNVPKPILYKYQAYDIANTFNLNKELGRLLRSDKTGLNQRLYDKILIPASEYLANVERNGLRVDLDRVLANKVIYEAECKRLEKAMNEIAHRVQDGDVNPRSFIQLGELMFDKLKIPTKVRATNDKVLQDLPPHEFVTLLREYRKASKALSTYILPILDIIGYDGRIHPGFLIHGTATGRLSCREPNLQNIPRLGVLRGQFVVEDGNIYLEVDLNQAELRVLAELSGDVALTRIYTDPDSPSIHHIVSVKLFGPDYTDEQKMRAKACTFGIVYGREAGSLAEEFDVSIQEAQSWIDGWFAQFPQAHEFLKKCAAAPTRGLHLKTPFGRRKRFGVVSPEKLKDLQNEAKNFPCQAIASDITLYSGIQFWKRLHNYGVKVVNTVHDSILFEMPNDPELVTMVYETVKAQLEETPRQFGLKKIPFKADGKVGFCWAKYDKKDKQPIEDGLRDFDVWKKNLQTTQMTA